MEAGVRALAGNDQQAAQLCTLAQPDSRPEPPLAWLVELLRSILCLSNEATLAQREHVFGALDATQVQTPCAWSHPRVTGDVARVFRTHDHTIFRYCFS